MVTKSAYGASAQEIGELFADYLDGNSNRPALTLSLNTLPAEARNAIEKSFEAFGYAPESCTFATLSPNTDESGPSDVTLDAHAVFLLVEGLDPLFVIAADKHATDALAQAYRTAYDTDSPVRVFGRSGVAFSDFTELLATPQGKQSAWRLLKSMSA